jgi:CUE domain
MTNPNPRCGHGCLRLCAAQQRESPAKYCASSSPTMTSSPPEELDVLQPTPAATEPQPPANPPRPLSPREQAKITLKEAFPSVEDGIIDAVLIASGGHIEPAFNALLGIFPVPLRFLVERPLTLVCSYDRSFLQARGGRRNTASPHRRQCVGACPNLDASHAD